MEAIIPPRIPTPKESDPGADEAEIPPLARILIREFREDRQVMRDDMTKMSSTIDKMADQIPDKKLVYYLAGVVCILLCFSVALLALQLGLDPRVAAGAARSLVAP